MYLVYVLDMCIYLFEREVFVVFCNIDIDI